MPAIWGQNVELERCFAMTAWSMSTAGAKARHDLEGLLRNAQDLRGDGPSLRE
jgi:hypothetical protein